MFSTVKAIFPAALISVFLFSPGAGAAHHESAHDESPTIVEIAAGNGNFSTLVAAVKAAGLLPTLSAEGPYTVFAPTDAAFAKLPEGTLETLLAPENKEQLVDILTYHVVPGAVTAAQVSSLSSATTVEGSDVAIEVTDAGVRINDALVVQADIEAANGVIHVIDTVILPAS
jgi:uncharacterized surface protein with fasciclin (FAS1) repeats